MSLSDRARQAAEKIFENRFGEANVSPQYREQGIQFAVAVAERIAEAETLTLRSKVLTEVLRERDEWLGTREVMEACTDIYYGMVNIFNAAPEAPNKAPQTEKK